MEFQELFDTYSSFVKKNILPIVLATLGMIFFVYGLIVLLGASKSASDGVVFEPGNKEVEAAKSTQTIAVDIEGAVVKPGVYKLSENAIMQDAFIASGGLSLKADRDWVSKNINQAAKLSDGAKIYIPKIGEQMPVISNSSSVSGSVNTSGLININTASEKELDSLSGVGPVTAQKIIDSRPYGSINELLDKKVVGSKVFSNIKDKISTY